MKLPRISISFSGDEHHDHSLETQTTMSGQGTALEPEEAQAILPRAAAIRAVLAGSDLSADELLAAREHVRSIQYAWKEFQSNLEQDRVLLQVARRVELLEQLQELESRQVSAVSRLRSSMGQPQIVEAHS